jgi:hypothetical protein
MFGDYASLEVDQELAWVERYVGLDRL